MDTFKCVFNSLEELIRQIEKSREMQNESNENLREAYCSSVEREKIRSNQMNEYRQKLKKLTEKHSLWINEDLKHLKEGRFKVRNLKLIMSERHQQIDGLKHELKNQNDSLQSLVKNANSVSQGLQDFARSAKRDQLIQSIKKTAEIQQQSLKNVLKSVQDIETMISNDSNLFVNKTSKEDATTIQRLQEFNERTTEDLIQERNRNQIEKEELIKEQKRLSFQISVLNYNDQFYKQKIEKMNQSSDKADKIYVEQENKEPTKRTVTRGMRKQMESANGTPTKATTQKKRALNTKKPKGKATKKVYYKDEIDELVSDEQDTQYLPRKRRKVTVSIYLVWCFN
ncbi:unnamed protein product [Rhizopus stolonifer]